MSNPRRSLAIGVVLGLALVALVGAGAVLAQGQPASRASLVATPTTAQVRAVGAPNVVSGSGGIAVRGSGVASSAIVYPYFAGSPGIAPDHTIVVTGVGQADVASDRSNRSSAQQAAIAAAIADAKAQADAVASTTGLSISGVLSVSVAVSPSYGVMPMAAQGSGKAVCPPTVFNGGAGSGGAPAPMPICEPTYPQTLSASATVAYRVG